MNRELLIVIEQIGREKGIDKETLFEALESALLSASRKTLFAADNVRMEIDSHTGALNVFGRKKVVEEVTDNKLEISLADAKALNPEAELEDELEQELPPQEFGRIAAQTAKQVILQRVRDAERDRIFKEFEGKDGQILRGVVHRIEKRNVIVEIGKAEAILPEREQIHIIEWSHAPATFVARALSPAKVSSVTIGEPGESEAEATALIVVPDNQLSLAIGKKGQNARLAAKLTGMRIDIKSEAELAAPAPAEDDRRTALSRLAGDLTPAMIDALVAAGLDSPEAIKRAGRERLAEIAELGDRADKLYTAAEEWTTAHASEGRPDGGADPE